MSAKTTTVIAGMALAAGITAANAGEPIRLTDAQLDGGVAAAGGYDGLRFNFSKYKDVYVKEYKDIYAKLYSDVYVDDPFAHAEAGAEAYDPYGFGGGFSETLTFTHADPYSSHSVSESTSAVDNSYYRYYYNKQNDGNYDQTSGYNKQNDGNYDQTSGGS